MVSELISERVDLNKYWPETPTTTQEVQINGGPNQLLFSEIPFSNTLRDEQTPGAATLKRELETLRQEKEALAKELEIKVREIADYNKIKERNRILEVCLLV